MPTDRPIPFIQICSREYARESDISAYDGVITIEDTTEKNPGLRRMLKRQLSLSRVGKRMAPRT